MIKKLVAGFGLMVGCLGFVNPAIAAKVTQAEMPAYCRGEAAGQFNTKPTYIKTEKVRKNKDGSYSVKGTADLGNQGKKPFECHFSKTGEFLHFMSLVDEGKM